MLHSFRKAAKELGVDRRRISRWAQCGLIRVVMLENEPRIDSSELQRIRTEGVGKQPRRYMRRPPRTPKKSDAEEIRAIKL